MQPPWFEGSNTAEQKGKQMEYLNPAPGFKKHSHHSVELRSERTPLVLRFGGEVIADTKCALVVVEGGYPPRYYIPKVDVRMDLLEATDLETHCPFKGDARYWTIRAGGQVLKNGAWAYDYPFDETAGLAGFIGFYTEEMDLVVDSEKASAS